MKTSNPHGAYSAAAPYGNPNVNEMKVSSPGNFNIHSSSLNAYGNQPITPAPYGINAIHSSTDTPVVANPYNNQSSYQPSYGGSYGSSYNNSSNNNAYGGSGNYGGNSGYNAGNNNRAIVRDSGDNVQPIMSLNPYTNKYVNTIFRSYPTICHPCISTITILIIFMFVLMFVFVSGGRSRQGLLQSLTSEGSAMRRGRAVCSPLTCWMLVEEKFAELSSETCVWTNSTTSLLKTR